MGAALLLGLIFSVDTARTQSQSAGDNFKSDFLYYINKTRAQGCKCGSKWFPPAQPLTWSPLLAKSASGHARDMNNRHYFSHDSKDGRTMMSRIVQAGYYYNGWRTFYIGENIAQGQESIQQVMEEWFESPGHCENLMNPLFKEVGVPEYNDYWVQDFGGREAYSPEQQKLIAEGKMKLGKPILTEHH